MSSNVVLNINPDAVRFAREEAGCSVPEITSKLGIGEGQYLELEGTGTNVSFDMLRVIARTYKRQIAFFFLPEIPKKLIKPTDYRNIDLLGQGLSGKTLLAIRRSNRFRNILLELNGSEYYKTKYEWLSHYVANLKNYPLDYTDVAVWIRQLLNYTLEDQIDDASLQQSYLNWRNSFERHLGINVFQFNMPTAEIQGFSYSDTYPYCIAVNGSYSIASRIFTLFHELAHILRMQSGLCIPDDVRSDQTIELDCNSFAGKVLLPDQVLVTTLDPKEIYKRARKLKVSSEVYLRRLYSLERISDSEFFALLGEIRSSVKLSTGFGISTPLQKSLNTRGRTLFNSVIEAVNRERISYSRASDVLGLKINYLLST